MLTFSIILETGMMSLMYPATPIQTSMEGSVNLRVSFLRGTFSRYTYAWSKEMESWSVSRFSR